MQKISMNRKNDIIYFNQLSEAFIKICKVKNLSPRTIEYYELSAYTFNKYCGNPELDKIKDSTIVDLVLELKQVMKPVSMNSRLRGVRAIFNYGERIGIMRKVDIPMIKYDKEAKEGYTEAEMRLLLAKPNLKKCSFTEYRNWVMVNYLYGTGCRLATLMNIKIRDLDIENKLVTNRHMKTRRQTIVPLPSTLIAILRDYLEVRGGKEDEYLFPQESNAKFTDRGIKSAIRHYNLSRGVTRTSIHAFRHSWAKTCILNGMDIFTLQKLGCWRDLNMVRNYVNLYSTDIKGYDEINPLENLYSNMNKRITMKGR